MVKSLAVSDRSHICKVRIHPWHARHPICWHPFSRLPLIVKPLKQAEDLVDISSYLLWIDLLGNNDPFRINHYGGSEGCTSLLI